MAAPTRSCLASLALALFAFPALAQEDPTPEDKEKPPVKLEPFRLDEVVLLPEMWGSAVEALVESQKDGPLGLTWVSDAQNAARAARPLLFFMGVPAQELLIEATNGMISEATVLYFARGNLWTQLDKTRFDVLVKEIVAALNTRTGRTAVQPRRDTQSAARAYVFEWQAPDAHYELAYSYQKSGQYFLPEFIRLRMRPPQNEKKPLLQVKAGATVTRGLERAERAAVRRDANGDVWIEDVPMVDQGERGYCVVASVERVLRYYGVETDQHELAQISGASALFGASPVVMNEQLRKLSARLKVRPRTIIDFDEKDLERTVEDYNRVARSKRENQAGLEWGSPTGTYEQFQIEILRESRSREKAGYAKFLDGIRKAIEERMPLLWSLQVGVVSEPEIPQGFGGHMRLIIGLNEKTGEVIYSDSWGAGHEVKRMPLADAWAVTTNLAVVEPSRL